MGAPRSSSALSQRTKNSMPSFSLYPSIVTKDSKAQHILGISRTELHNARSESTKPRPRHRASSPALKSSTSSPFVWSRDRHIAIPVDEAAVPFDLEIRRGSISMESDSRGSYQTPSLNRYPSVSTLRSLYDTATAPLRNSQQRSNSISQESPQKSGSPSIVRSGEQGMEHARSPRFFRSAKLRSIIEIRKTKADHRESKTLPNFSPTSRGSSFSISTGKSPLMANESILTSTSSQTSPELDHMESEFPKEDSTNVEELDQKISSEAHIPNSTLQTPYAKIHVRKPKAGTKNWFDDLEGVVSDEGEADEEDVQLVSEQKLNNNDDEDVCQSVGRSASMDNSSLPLTYKTMLNQHDEIPELSAEPSTLLEPIDEYQPHAEVHELPASPSRTGSSSPVRTNSSQQNIEHVSESEEGHEYNDALALLQVVQSLDSLPAIRESIAIEIGDESDVEIGFAHAVETTGKARGNRPSPIKAVNTRHQGNSLDPISIDSTSEIMPIVVDSDADSIRLDDTDLKDVNEDTLLDSFPATPTDNRVRRTSSPSSASFSDDTSVMSMRLMKVTRQEENLIAAMRLKRATMKRAERAAARKSALRMLEQDEKIVVSTNRLSTIEQMAEMKRATMIQYGARLQLAGLGLHDNNSIGPDVSSNTPVIAEPYEIGISPVRKRSRVTYRHDQQSSKALQPVLEPSANITELLRRRPSELQPRRLSFSSTASEESRKRESNIIVLDNINSALSPRVFPSQLFIESPFTTWERMDVAVTLPRYGDIID